MPRGCVHSDHGPASVQRSCIICVLDADENPFGVRSARVSTQRPRRRARTAVRSLRCALCVVRRLCYYWILTSDVSGESPECRGRLPPAFRSWLLLLVLRVSYSECERTARETLRRLRRPDTARENAKRKSVVRPRVPGPAAPAPCADASAVHCADRRTRRSRERQKKK